MPNGYDPQKGQLLVPFDLKQDVVEPLEHLTQGFKDLNQRFEDHLSQVENSIKTRMEPLARFVEQEIQTSAAKKIRRAQFKKIMLWGVAIGGPLLLAAVAKIMGVPI